MLTQAPEACGGSTRNAPRTKSLPWADRRDRDAWPIRETLDRTRIAPGARLR
jgi:hypothetical protein